MGRSGGGSGRSSGGGGGRSCGSRSSSSSSRSRSSSSSRSSTSRSSYSSGSSSHSHSWGGGYRHSHHHYPGGYRGNRLGCGFIVGVVILIYLIVNMSIIFSSFSEDTDVTKSTTIREPLPKGSVVETDYYTDDIGDWIGNTTKLTTGMKNFYKATGVQPYLYISDSLDGNTKPNDAFAEEWLNKTYDELFDDEAHTMLLFFERDGRYTMWYLNGKQAKTVMDNEAMDILMDYVELYYYSDLTEDEMFSKAYDMAAKRIMEVTRDPIPWYAYFFILIAVIIIILILFKIWKAKKTQKNIEDENTRAILEAPLEGINKFPEE